jgi:hypothetical protein
MPRPIQVTPADITLRLQAGGPLTAQALATALGVNQSTISRALARLGDAVVPLGAARRARYALRRRVRGADDRWTVCRVDASGRAREWVRVHTLHGGCLLEWLGSPPAWAAHATDREGYVDGLPFFLADLCPQGFLGRALARRMSELLLLPGDPRQWGDDDTLYFLQSQGFDLPGDLVVGDGPMRTVLTRQLEPVEEDVILDERDCAHRYPDLAVQAMAGEWAGSSAGGEQPKFLVALRDAAGETRRVLVKFSPLLDHPSGRRWADLLAAEAQALGVLAGHGLATPGARILDAGGRRFLEVNRHDRAGRHGRRGVVSLSALDAALASGPAINTWTGATEALGRDGLADPAGLVQVRRLQTFGELIGNTDMHFGNLSFWLDDALPFRPAPAYDMLPMLWAPNSQGESMDRTFAPQPPLPGELPVWSEAAAWAGEFWRRVADDAAVSAEFAARAREAGAVVARLREHFAG